MQVVGCTVDDFAIRRFVVEIYRRVIVDFAVFIQRAEPEFLNDVINMFAFLHSERKRAVGVFCHTVARKGERSGRIFPRLYGNGFFRRFSRELEFKMYRAFRTRIKELFGGQKIQVFVFASFGVVYEKECVFGGCFHAVVRENAEDILFAHVQYVGFFGRADLADGRANFRHVFGIVASAI